MLVRCRAALLISLISLVPTAHAQGKQGQSTDWGGGYLRGSDSASVTVATSGAGAPKPAPSAAVVAPPRADEPKTDWGGGYLRGPDLASTTIATSGAGKPKPK